ncbi:MAG: lysophospholipid acyltransferase family protein [Roseibium sp.]|uniref:lysophospholipid acyltransferase family protein n=1 Tax=Roseibium sp. TaxID=1936156 RepID=UPI001B052D96|nr:lysophospholipid acyltransferase family protein [Roseibium sp.]MBO6893721.1 lysophospholipid acyltransferase family protein [Roseibium sp.]MBO6928542.1 lysophospholipid acyltransferase family protein [Roseibium sp.]
MDYAEFSYANPEHPPLKRWTIRMIEGISGRGKLIDLYETWKTTMVGTSDYIWSDLLGLINLDVSVADGEWPPKNLPDGPLVLIANHPYGIGDGLAILSLAERLNRPFKILINNELLKVPEVRPFSLPVDFEETKQALKTNMETRKEALRLLKEGTTIIVFPGGGVATASKPFGRAEELPWKTFTAKMIRSSKATVLPLYFDGQNSWLFHLVSKYSLTLRLSLLVREFRRILGSAISARAGRPIPYETLSGLRDQKEIMNFLQTKVMEMAPPRRERRRLSR